MRTKQLPCQPDFLQGRSAPAGVKAESVPNFYQVQTFRWRHETRTVSASRFQPCRDFVYIHFVDRDARHRPDDEPDHFVKKTPTCDFDYDSGPASPNLNGPNGARGVLFFFAAIGYEYCEIMRADKFFSGRF